MWGANPHLLNKTNKTSHTSLGCGTAEDIIPLALAEGFFYVWR